MRLRLAEAGWLGPASAVAALLLVGAALLYWNGKAQAWEVNADTITYIAAGERLNAGHPLYALSPGDRPIAPRPPYETVPLLSPPFIAVLWRPLAALPNEFGRYLWWFGTFAAIWGTLAYLLFRIGLRAAVVVGMLSWAIGIELLVGNVNGFLITGVVLVWLYREQAWVGGLIAVMAALKLGPAALLVFLAGQRNWRSLGVALGVGAVCLGMSLIGAGVQAHLDYIGIAGQIYPQDFSLSALTGVPWMNSAVLVGGSVLSLSRRRRSPTSPSAWQFL